MRFYRNIAKVSWTVRVSNEVLEKKKWQQKELTMRQLKFLGHNEERGPRKI